MLLNISLVLMSTQIIHLIWLSANVTLPLFNIHSLEFNVLNNYITFAIFAGLDYLEIPALISTLILYSKELIKGRRKSISIIYMSMLILQFIHIFYLTDEYIYEFGAVLPFYIVVIAVLIDYAEIIVLIDLIKKKFNNTSQRSVIK